MPYRRLRVSGEPPSTTRRRRDFERQRLDAIALVRSKRELIRSLGDRYGVAPEAIAGAILWDALENPYRRRFVRLGPGKVHPLEPRGPSAAERAERSGLILSPPRNALERLRRIRDPDWAVVYVAAILAHHARNYAEIAGVRIGDAPGILCTLYQGGDSVGRARRLAVRRRRDRSAMPREGDEMGPWVRRNLAFIRPLLDGEAAERVVGRRAEPAAASAPRALLGTQ
ncbi:MAG: DUF1402 family protein [Solirubrobacterales bacterium]